jgi:ABC-type ATPase with predicted acetyltransferase domain
MGNPETVFTEVEMVGELEKGEVLQIWEKDVKLRRRKDTGSRTYYYKVTSQYLCYVRGTH